MFVADRLLFVELHRTGSGQIRHLLSLVIDGERRAKHSPAGQRLRRSRMVLGSIRCPWDWYVSLWAFGCAGRGGLFRRLAGVPDPLAGPSPVGRAEAAEWRACYARVDEPRRFRAWLRRILDPQRSASLGEGYARSPFAGFMTHRYARLYWRDVEHISQGDVTSTNDLRSIDRDRSYVDVFIRNEHLEPDLIDALRRCQVGLPSDVFELFRAQPRLKATGRMRDLTHYYDDASVRLVQRREWFIVEKFGYRCPATRDEAERGPRAREEDWVEESRRCSPRFDLKSSG